MSGLTARSGAVGVRPGTGRTATLLVIAATATLGFAGTAAPAAAAPQSPADRPAAAVADAAERRIAGLLPARLAAAGLGGTSSAAVVDAKSGRWIAAVRPDLPLAAASNTKIATAMTALRTLGPAHRFTTSVARTGPRRVTLIGGGDPSLASRHLASLAAQSALILRRRGVRAVTLGVADGMFGAPTRAPGWGPRIFYPRTVSPVRALVVDSRPSLDTGLDAGRTFAAMLRARGVQVVGVARAPRSASAPVIARVYGERLDTMVRSMLTRSDNDIAEALFRQVALRWGQPPTWTGGAAAQRHVLRLLGTPLAGVRSFDGSGLSRAGRLTARALVHLVGVAAQPGAVQLRAVYFERGMPVAGVTGTLRPAKKRFTTAPSSCAAGRVVAKTGTLSDVVALSGIARSADGRPKAFSLIVNGRAATLSAKRAVDSLAATITGCW